MWAEFRSSIFPYCEIERGFIQRPGSVNIPGFSIRLMAGVMRSRHVRLRVTQLHSELVSAT